MTINTLRRTWALCAHGVLHALFRLTNGGEQPADWTQSHWPPGLWCDGRVWLWQQTLVAAALLPLRRSGWTSDPWQRPPPRHLTKLMTVLGALLGMRLAMSLHALIAL